MCSRVTLDGHMIEECVKVGDGKFREGAWVKIAEEYQNHPEAQELAKYFGRLGRLTKRYYGCWCVRWLDTQEAVAQALGQATRTTGQVELCKLGNEYYGTWLCYVTKAELDQLTHDAKTELSRR
mmetsp:Transcript_40019/g.62467  ORF Transcript_40019/g.62467 Transcript_40019/m.62467 type:complete len:124 (-) Transcript_40019:144-515(-)